MSKTLQGITLKGSAELVAEFFSFGINSILYQRGIYPAETFSRVTQYDMSLQLTTDPKLKTYLTNVVTQLKGRLTSLLVLLHCFIKSEIISVFSRKPYSTPAGLGTLLTLPKASIGAFDLLIYTDKDLEVPEQWEESGPQLIDQSEEVRLRSFTTSIHKVNSMVAYKRTNSM
uniref:MAD2 mitotic arrest deficient-like 1 (yeast) n=1 Tax=Astyanax mexicanus TaxID=7994 RepID=W5LET4_ASTMX